MASRHSMVRAVAALVGLLATSCRPDEITRPGPGGVSTGPANSPSFAAASPVRYDGTPPSRQFGPDTYRPGLFTGTPTGLSCPEPTPPAALKCSGFLASGVDGTALDVTVTVPQGQGSGPFPLIVQLHGYGGSKNSDAADGDELTSRGFTVLRYSARGFGKSWGQVNLADLNLEIGDLQSMIGQTVDDPRLLADESRVGVFGASYGGGQSWLALVRPTFASPLGKQVQIRTAVPIVPWTDLLYALRPNGEAENSVDVAGFWKLSMLEGLFLGGIRRDASRPYPNYPDYLFLWNAYILVTEPNNLPPIGSQIVDGAAGYRSVWWQQAFWDGVRSGNRIPVFQIQGFTDDLFPLPEALRMYYALRSPSVAGDYPISLYLGDVGHPRATNKSGEVGYAKGLIQQWFDYYLKSVGAPPVLPGGVLAAITRPRDVPFSASDVIRVDSYDQLATAIESVHFPGDGILTFNPANPSGFFFDPFVMVGSESLQPNPPPPPPDVIPGDVVTDTVSVAALQSATNPAGVLIAGQAAVEMHLETTAFREQLDVRLYDDAPGGATTLVTRGTYTLDTGSPLVPIGARKVVVPTYGNLWQAGYNDRLRLEITNVDSPYLTPSRVPSVTHISNVRLDIPVHQASTATAAVRGRTRAGAAQ
jgi:predicted acyl esterase